MADSVEKTYSAKQVASRIGTDAKQLRKFFRDSESGFDAVGQGGRYEFPESQLADIKQAFDAWAATKTRRNRSPQKKLATSAGIVPRQRKQSPDDEAPRWKRDMKNGLHGNALDGDTLEDRTTLGIAGRVEKHGLTVTTSGRFKELPKKTPAEILNPHKGLDRRTIPGLVEDDEGLTHDTPHNELQPIVDMLEGELSGDLPDLGDFDPDDFAEFYDE